MPFKVKGLVFIPLQLLLLLLVKANEQMEADKRHHYIVKICVQKGDHFYGGFRLMKGKTSNAFLCTITRENTEYVNTAQFF